MAFLESNSDLVTHGALGNAFSPKGDTGDVSVAMRAWLSACMEDPEFQARLASWYQRPG